MKFAELSDDQWDFIKPHLPPQPIVGIKRADDRKIINCIFYVLMTGYEWQERWNERGYDGLIPLYV